MTLRNSVKIALNDFPEGPFESAFGFLEKKGVKNVPEESIRIGKALYDYIKKLFVEHGGKYLSIVEGEIDLDSPRLAELLDAIEKQVKDKVLIVRDIVVRQEVTDDSSTPAEWFEVHTTTQLDGYSPLKADRIRPGIHVISSNTWDSLHYVSEKFKKAVEANGLTGVQFVWIKDNGKYQAPQWFAPVPTAFLGRGVDHPWFDRRKADALLRKNENRSLFDVGRFYLDPEEMRSRVQFGDPVKDRLLKHYGDKLRIVGTRTYLRKHLPSTDFAFYLTYHDDSGGWCINRRARDILVNAKVLLPKECFPVLVVDELPQGAEDLDAKRPGTPTPFEREFPAEERKKAAAGFAELQKKPKPVREAKIADSLKLLKQTRKRSPESLKKPAKPDKITALQEQMQYKLPDAWLSVLAISDGGDLSGDCYLVPSAELPEYAKTWPERWAFVGADKRKDLLHFAAHGTGDSYAFVTSRTTKEGECPVVLISHETGQEERNWPTIAAFVEDVIAEDE